VNLYNRPENIVRVDRAAVRMPMRQIARLAAKPAPLPNNVLAGKDGKVYQRDERGNWKVNEGRVWKPARVPVTPLGTPPAAGGGKANGVTRGADRPAEHALPRPTPGSWPAERQVQPRTVPPTRPAPPTISPAPGNLEREYAARERVSQGNTPDAATPTAHPKPAREERPKEKTPAERKR
jgi:hypothetical protein